MSVQLKYRCETCGETFINADEIITHLQTTGNENHIVVETYLNEEAQGIIKQFVIESENGNKFKLIVDNDGVIDTQPLQE